MKKKRAVLLSLLLMVLAQPTFALEPVSLQLRWLHQAQFAGFYMAKEKGFYQDAGLNVTIKPGGNHKVPITEVLSGRAEFGVGNTEVLVAFGHGFPVTAMAAIFQHSPSVLIAKANSNIQTIHDLVGKRVMMFAGAEDAELLVLLARNNIYLSDLEQITTSADVDDLLSGKIDAFNGYLTNEPYYLQKQGEQPLIFNPADYGVSFYSDIIFTHQDFAQAHPDTVERFRNASLKGWYYALTHIDETLDVIEQQYRPMKSRDHLAFELESSAKMIMSDLIEIGHMNPNRWQTIADELSQLNIIPKTHIDENFLYPQRAELTWKDVQLWLQSGMLLLGGTFLAITYLTLVNRQLKREIARRIEAERKASEMARKDTLTGIANRYALVEELHRVVSQISPYQAKPALLFIDLDDFKQVNDTYGHHAGDRVLQQFCARITHLLAGQRSFFARLAGDEFVILLEATAKDDARALVTQISTAAQRPFPHGQTQIQIGASVGITFYRPGDTPDYFLSRADNMMYRNKRRSQKERLESGQNTAEY
ncbi:GGDEF domain-containing protein [Photobacterium atrarenae]|uniref:Thiamine pyrimidine synthase n=1 Tax=Photobacterium atrarenae TaxID=865757 RepID=A0ABY5GCV8_9GAMM|nr:GGDEF domain-containing protein [Photobacterium atrarenae]UTV27068.1 GGDEF domain-containing protein [Photobacterium atrarenae]